jgi:hypothetical protein
LEKQILNLTSTSTPRLLVAGYGSDQPTGQPYGRPVDTLIPVAATRAGGSAMTAVNYRARVSRDGTNWVILPTYKVSDPTKTFAASQSVAVAAGTTVAEGLNPGADGRKWLYLLVEAQAVGADAVAGDSAQAWLEI